MEISTQIELIDLDVVFTSSEEMDRLLALLPEDECSAIAKYLMEKDRHASIVSRVLQRSYVGRYFGFLPERIPRTSQVCFPSLSRVWATC